MAACRAASPTRSTAERALEGQWIPDRADKSFSHELVPTKSGKGPSKRASGNKRKNADEQPSFEAEPASDLRNPFNH
jgi:hypothetical protein